MKTKICRLYNKYGYFLYVLIVPVYLVLFFTVEGVVTSSSNYFVSYLPLDDFIPFCEWFIFPYILWYPFLLFPGLYLMLTDVDTFRRYLIYIGMSFYTVTFICFLFPNGQNLRVDIPSLGRDNIALSILGWIYSADTNTNVCPSVHVVGAVGSMFAMLSSPKIKSRAFKFFAVLFGVLISISTVFVKQHSVLDIIVAVPYSLFFCIISFKLIKLKKKYSPIIES